MKSIAILLLFKAVIYAIIYFAVKALMSEDEQQLKEKLADKA